MHGIANVMLCQHSRQLCRQLSIRLHRGQLAAQRTSALARLASRLHPPPAWTYQAAGAGGDRRGVRRHSRIARLPLLCSTMTAAEPHAVPTLDRSQFTSTLHLKALRLHASRCQEFVKALQGCVNALAPVHFQPCVDHAYCRSSVSQLTPDLVLNMSQAHAEAHASQSRRHG